ncbi:acyl-CoA/acyl-ACP dehydrogenase [Mycolicibacillus parakoreensis]|uniref:Acyl-CoA/acyl-ACP dehydrogenase n=1 Tax=Mycolicibacillus parakoreensis TaxID=1069221 RepID=A0ABY3U1N5_9MYCO|nr:acyl-CoA dehydrogenase family protein [Mycolicibacillus parakoreensis]MCV7317158.1 acyl-CoA/acyl-ACP dehydrogenase [Mycolicibacillus parakoreensis]ULN51477.1 acyl-CoA/acyl-ACP dehydrogenase [Mycolicibacillus parakoreensis]
MSDSTSESRLFAATARTFLDKTAPLSRQRALHAQGRSYDPTWWRQAAELGWAGLLVPEELGGGSVSGCGLRDLAMVAEEIGRSVAPGPLYAVSTVLAGLVDAENAHEHAATVGALVSGERIATWAGDEPGRVFRPHRPAMTATSTAAGYRLNGVKDRVEAAEHADLILVGARTDDGAVRQFLVGADTAGVTVHPQDGIDLVKRYARVEFSDVEIDRSTVVGGVGQAGELIDRQTQVAITLACAETVGICDAVLTMTVEWTRNRYSFGRSLASYQAIKHRLADMTMWLHACRGIVAATVQQVATRDADAAMWASAAKSYLGEHAGPLLQECVQLHGGIGVTWEHDLHLYLRRATLYRNLLGTPGEHHQALFHAASTTEATP